MGNWDESVLLTFSPYKPRYDQMWCIDVWKKMLVNYYGNTGQVIHYHIVSNRGSSGMEQCSAHVVFENPDALDMTLIIRQLERHGKVTISDAGGDCTSYQAKNLSEPDAYFWSSKLRKR